MSNTYQQRIKNHILDEETFLSAVFSGQQKGKSVLWEKVSLRPVLLKDKRHIQFSYFDGKQDISKNYAGDELAEKVDELLALAFKSIALRASSGDIRVQITKKGKAIIHQDKAPAKQPQQPDLSHNHRKDLLLPFDKPNPFLQTIGIMTAEGRIRAKMQDKFWQINRFLQLVHQSIDLKRLSHSPLRVVDCGCGSAYLSFATYHYLSDILERPTQMVGIDLKSDLLQRRGEQARNLGWDGLRFEASRIIDYTPAAPPDIVLALHACDTATDESLAQAARWGSRYIFSVPCCHHHLQAQLPSVGQAVSLSHKPVLRHGILKERLGDILTDAFRALILRIMGYRSEVVEFISSEHTDKNLMIRAVKASKPGQAQFLREYQAMKAEWGATPYLEELLGKEFPYA
ncbi:MAG: hypothetical protein B6243_00970 [Anaerolineaceae bacterium 4572_5.2]|nr:MAG: hypothetical protein B6243_00970 [Anaerolineaceae bacterium 4572_5.2]